MISKITKITLCKKPFTDTFDWVLNLLSFGDYGFKKKKHNFTVYHCYIILHCEDGSIIKIDKQARVKCKYIQDKQCDDVVKLDVKFDFATTPYRMLLNTQRYMGTRYNNYCFVRNNCSSFMKAMLISNNILDDEYLDFAKQDALNYMNSIETNVMIFICIIVNFIYNFI
jgi:hypothetical protein